ncbi:MAG TPA: Rieske (2Fe-2S) protein [Blastocatellia bacterium]|nr:Rieske (2Fe-2S) protein [Blastocatellia bacterium]
MSSMPTCNQPYTETCGQTYNLGLIDNIPLGEGRAFALDCAMVAVFRAKNGGVFATQAWCPHRQGPLADSIVGGGQILCPLHGYKFDLETGGPIENECEGLKTYAVSVSETGEILLQVNDQ